MRRKIIFLLTLCFVVLGTAFAQRPRQPQQLRIEKSYQREVDIQWNKTLLTGIKWEIQLEGQQPVRTTDIHHTIENLEPDTEYTVKVRMIKDQEYSAFATLNFKTEPLGFKVDDPRRVPYLRTIRIDANAPRELPLYFTDLATSEAKIAYKLNGQAVEPVNNRIVIDTKKYTDKLEVVIDEGDNRHFRLIYFVNVPKGI